MEVAGYKYVIQRTGVIRVINPAGAVSNFLDLTSKITSAGGEQGVLGIDFHPSFPTTGQVFVNYTNTAGDTVVARYTATSTSASLASETILLTYDQPFDNHNGGHLEFGSDGFLYIASGDGGGGGDPNNNAQNDASRLGKILRLNVSTLAVTNYAKGLRNPWRFSFDGSTMWIGDVGQGTWEEIDRAASAGLNFGWRVMEGNHCYNATTCTTTGFTAPVFEYNHSAGDCSITGGYVYRGSVLPSLTGRYIYGDYCTGKIWHMSTTGTSNTLLTDQSFQISSFGRDEEGEIYVVGYNTGTIYKIAP
jgi:glucose/arabinose dehydrogenase